MRYYQICGLNVESDFTLQGAYEIEKPSKVHVTIGQEEIEEKYTEIMPVEYEHEIGHGFINHQEKWSCARFRGIAVFVIREGNRIGYHLYEGYEAKHVSDLMIEYCLSVLAYQRNMLMIHGSGICYKGKTLIISGVSGAGKSSLAEEFLERGYQMMSDDVVPIDVEQEDLYGYPAFPLRKLCADAVERKGLDKSTLIPIQDDGREKYGMYLQDEYYTEKAPLGAMVILEKGNVEKPVITEILGADKLKYLTEYFIRKEIYKQISYPKESFMKAIKVANKLPMYKVIRPENQITVKEQADMLEKILENPDK